MLGGKTVIDSEATIMGDVGGLEFNVSGWKVTHICVNLSDKAIEALGYKKPRFLGNVLVDIPVELVKAVSDVVSLDKTIEEIKSVLETHS